MKRYLIILCLVLFVNTSYAQHLSFEGISINGSIVDFQRKLTNKGMVVNKEKSKDTPIGQRIFRGKFQGYNAEITVFFNRKTKDVYKVAAEISSQKKERIQAILDRSISKIEHKYTYRESHDLYDGRDLHFKYYILPTNASADYIGIIHVKPSYEYNIPKGNHAGKKNTLASYIITFTYEDALNTSKLTPTTTEPMMTFRRLVCDTPENYDKFLVWANNYIEHKCFERAIYYLTRTLDYYKYGCCPTGTEGLEKDIEQFIMNLQRTQIGRIKTAYYNEYANVYRIPNKTTKYLDCIQYAVNSNYIQIKLNSHHILEQIKALEKLKIIYKNKKLSIVGKKLHEYWRENIDITMPALIGRENKSDNFVDITWKEKNLTMNFSQYKQELRINVDSDDSLAILQFSSESEIDNYISVLRNALR